MVIKSKLFFLCLVLAFQVNAQETNAEKSTCLVCSSKNHLHVAPYRFSLKEEIPFIAVGLTTFLASELLRVNNGKEAYTEEELLILDRNDVNRLDRPTTYKYNLEAAKVSDIIRLGVVVMPALFLTNHHTRKDIGGLVLLTAEVVAINYGFTNLTKYSFNRTRPYVYNEDVPVDVRTNEQSRISFFSGHASHTAAVSFLFAKVINDYHPDLNRTRKIVLWGVATAIPAVTAYLRVQSGNHFPTDVIAGSVIGAGIGWLVPHLHKVKTQITLSPYSFRDANGVSFSYKF